MSSVPVAYPRGSEPPDLREPDRSRAEQACACGSAPMWRPGCRVGRARRVAHAAASGGGAPKGVGPCKFLFFPSRIPPAERRAKPEADAAAHNPIVLINENTMPETMTGRGHRGPSAWVYSIKRHSRGVCGATRAPAEQSPINPRTIGGKTPVSAPLKLADRC